MFINDLPPEILAEICQLFSSRRPFGTRKDRGYIYFKSRQSSPLSFIHVCRYWRMVGISTKFFWSALNSNRSVEATTQWLRFSEPALLHLELLSLSSKHFNQRQRLEADVARRQMLQLFSEHADRWSSLFFLANNSLCQDFASMLRHGAAAQSPLDTLEIEIGDEDTSAADITDILSAVDQLKSLRHICWTFRYPQASMPKLFPWSSLKTIYIYVTFSISESVVALMQCTSATEVTLLGTHWSGLRPFTSSNHLCILRNLTYLELNHRPFDVLEHFTLPSLSTLVVDTIRNRPPQLDAFITRSLCPLRELIVKDVHFSMSNEEIIDCLLIPCLQSVPKVKVKAPGWRRRTERIQLAGILGRSDMFQLPPRLTSWDGYLGWCEEKPHDAITIGQAREDR